VAIEQAAIVFKNTCPPDIYEAWQKIGGYIGDYTYGPITVRGFTAAVRQEIPFTIGKFCSIATGVNLFLCIEHNIDFVTTFPFNSVFRSQWPHAKKISGHPKSNGPIHIGNDVWLGSDVTVMSGVRVGDGAVVAHRSIVTKDVGPYEVWGGIPARKLKDRFDEQTKLSLLEIAWWDLPVEVISSAVPRLMSSDIADFIDAMKDTRVRLAAE
jgi:acetyltransferase-like isoleucine patch superfamily enzyme